MTFSHIDVKIRKQTEDSIAHRVPAIRVLAKRYNTMCAKLNTHSGQHKHPSAAPPTPLNMDRLFDPEANQHMWMSQGLYPSGGQPPPYLFDSRVREGISAKLVLDRAEEEEHRLQIEAVSMAQWIKSQLENTDHALKACTGQHLVHIHFPILLIHIVR